MVWLGVCLKKISSLVIFDKGTVNHESYIEKVLPAALKFGNKMFGDRWIFHQDGARVHIRQLSQQWCQDHFPDFIDKYSWPPNSPDLNPVGYCIWDEFNQAIHWDRVKSKKTLIEELKCAVKRIRPEIILQSCNSWNVRPRHISENNGNYFGK